MDPINFIFALNEAYEDRVNSLEIESLTLKNALSSMQKSKDEISYRCFNLIYMVCVCFYVFKYMCVYVCMYLCCVTN